KNKTKDECQIILNQNQNILNLQQQNFALINNQQNQLMALPVGFAQPEFPGVNNDANILTILDRSLKREAREWYHREFDNKNWELQNVLDNSGIGATIVHIQDANAVAITGAVASFSNVPLGLSAKIQKYGDQLGYTLAQKKTHFLSGVRPDIRDEIYRIGQTKPINDIIDSLAELELRYGILQQASSQPRHASISPAIPDAISQQLVFPIADMQKMIQNIFAKERAESKANIEKLKAKLQAQQPQVATVEIFNHH
ncbi:156_t:CDS:2, partial [Gigaspora margarita]